jgi:hypothetical protein
VNKAILLRTCAALALPLAVSAVAPTAAYAQETTSTINGQVVANGQPVSGATVVVTHEPSGTTDRAVTDAEGQFSISGLRVGGPFNVRVTANGFEEATVTEISLLAGEPLRLPVELATAGAPTTDGQEIVVTASNLGARERSTGPITALGRTQIEGVASINRDIRDLARRDPFVTLDPTNSRTVEIAGNNGRLNRFSVDGTTFSDDFGLNNGGLPTSRGPVPYDAIEQFSVKVAPYDVSEGDFQGGAINVILRSGGNRLRGNAFYSYTNDSLTGDKTRDIPVDLEFNSKQFGGVVSGPIIKDTLFFMLGFEGTNESDPFDNGVGPGFANQVPGITLEQIDLVEEIANDIYGYDPLGLIQNAVEKDRKYVAKLDWNITEGQRASLTYIRNVGTQQFQQNAFTSAPAALGLQSNGYELEEKVNSGTFQLNSTWTDAFSTEFRASYRKYERDQTPFGGRDIAQFEVCLDPTSVGSATSCTGSRLFFGPDISRQTNDLDTENLSFDLTGRYQAGAHTFKAIAGYTKVNTFNLFLQRSLGDIYFDSLADFEAQRANRFRLSGAVPSLDPNDAAAEFSSQTYTFGLQDDWQVTDDFQLTAGVRWDFFGSNDEPPLNPNFLARQGFANTATFDEKDLFQPRIGFNWTPTRRLVIRGGTGIFGGGTPDVFVSNSFSNTGQLTNSIDISRDTSARGCNRTVGVTLADQQAFCAAALNGITGANFPGLVTNYLATNTGSLALAPVNAIDPDLKIASQWRSSLSVNYDANLGSFLGDGWLFGGDLLYSRVQNAYLVADFRSVPVGTLPDGRDRYGALVTGDTSNNQDLVLTNTGKGRSLIAVARFNKRFDFGLTIDGSYTRSNVKDVSALTSATAGSLFGNNAFSDPGTTAYGRSIYEIKDQWKFGADFRRRFFGDNVTRVSLFGEYRSGRPFSITGLDRGSGRLPVYGSVGNGGRVLLYVPQAGGDPRVTFDPGPTFVGTPEQRAAAAAANEIAFNNLVSELDLGKYRGRVVPKNSQTSPDFFKVDLHLSQELPAPFLREGKFQLFADVENLLNLINSDWGSLRQVGFPYTAPIVTVECAATSGADCTQYRYSRVTAPVEELNSRQSLYQIRVGARFRF